MGTSDPSLPLFLTTAHTVVERQRAAYGKSAPRAGRSNTTKCNSSPGTVSGRRRLRVFQAWDQAGHQFRRPSEPNDEAGGAMREIG